MTWAANVVPGNARNTFLIFLAATAASVPMAASVTTAFDDGGPLLAIPLALITVTGLTMVIIVAPGNDLAMRAALRYSIPVAPQPLPLVLLHKQAAATGAACLDGSPPGQSARSRLLLYKTTTAGSRDKPCRLIQGGG